MNDLVSAEFTFGFGELKAVLLACGIIFGWAFLRYVARRNGAGDRPADPNSDSVPTRTS